MNMNCLIGGDREGEGLAGVGGSVTALLPRSALSQFPIGYGEGGLGWPQQVSRPSEAQTHRQEELGLLFLKPNIAGSCPPLLDGLQDIPFQGTIPTSL